MKDVVALFDGDVIAYRAGFAAEKRYYFDVRHPPDSSPNSHRGVTYTSKKEALLNIPEEHIGHDRNLEPIENALQNVKSLINQSLEAIKEKYPEATIHYFTFVSGNKNKQNFRKEIDVKYKAHRKAEHRPTYLQDILQYLVDNHNGFATEGCEADDFFGHAQTEAITNDKLPIIVSVDKDLKQLAGVHLNLVTKNFEEVTPDQARLFFWRQMLQGDAADNIVAISGIGEKKAKRYIPDGTDDTKAKEVVQDFYQKEFKENWKKVYNNNAKLLWIWRKIPDECPYTF